MYIQFAFIIIRKSLHIRPSYYEFGVAVTVLRKCAINEANIACRREARIPPQNTHPPPLLLLCVSQRNATCASLLVLTIMTFLVMS